MKKLALFAILLVAFAHAEDSNESGSWGEEDVKELAEFVRDKLHSSIIFDLMRLAKQTQVKCTNVEELIETTVEKIGDCIFDIELGSETFCSLIRNNWAKCSKPGLEAIASCLPEESRELPILLGKIVLAVIDESCNSTFEQMLELFNPCPFEEHFGKYPQCSDLLKIAREHEGQFPSKSLICSMLPKLKNCGLAQQKDNCKNPITRQANTKFYDAIEDATKEECDSLNRT